MRAIVKNAWKVGELAHQFENGDNVDIETVDKFYPDAYILRRLSGDYTMPRRHLMICITVRTKFGKRMPGN